MKEQIDRVSEEALLISSGSFRTVKAFVRADGKFHTVSVTGAGRPELSSSLREQWKHSLELLTAGSGVLGLMMQMSEYGVSVLIAGGENSAPYSAGTKFRFGSGSCWEETAGLNRLVRIDLKTWPEAVPGFKAYTAGSYCGLPVHWEDGSCFGILCFLCSGTAGMQSSVSAMLEVLSLSMERDLELQTLRERCDAPYEEYARAMGEVLQYTPGGIFCYSAEENDQFSYLSDNMLRFLGYTQQEFVDKFSNRFSDMVYREDRERVLREISEQIRHDSFDRCEYRIEKKDGSLVWVHDEGHIISDKAGRRWFYVVIVDITESVLAQEQERRKFRSSMQALLAANPEAVGTIQFNLTRNLCGEGHSINDALQQLESVHYADRLFSVVAARITDPAQRRDFSARFNCGSLIAGFRNGKTSQSMEYIRKNDRGFPVWIRIYLNLLQNPDTCDVEGVAYSLDISREKRRDEILSIITGQEHDLIAVIHLKTGEIEACFLGETLPQAFRTMLSAPGAVCALEKFRANALERWLNVEDREKYRRFSDPAYYRPRMDRGEHYEFIVREKFPDVDGGEMYRKFQHYYLGNDRDTILVIESDVTQSYRRQQQELRAAKAEANRIQDILDSITSGICVLHMPDPDILRIVYVNQQMFRLLGFEPDKNDLTDIDDTAETTLRDYTKDAFAGIHPDDLSRVRKTFHDNFFSGCFVIDHYRTKGFGGKYYWIKEEVRLREVTPDYRVFYATYYDVSEEVRLKEELTEQLKAEKQLRLEATSANAAKTDFLSRMSHDMRTPLNGIIGMTYLAREQNNTAKTGDCLEKIDRSSKFLLGLINDVLDMSRAESSRIELNPEPYTLDEFNGYLDAVIRPLCKEKEQAFVLDERFSIRDRIPVADKLRCNQIIFNLLSNAVKYTPENGTITYRISGKELDHNRIQIDHEISDTGIGMSGEFQKVLFDPFTQENRNDVSEKRGTGLGLAIVKKLVDLMGGTIRVRSTPGMGTSRS